MKKITSIFALGLALLALSCTKAELTQINEINDHYTAPAQAQIMSNVTAASTWSLDRRYFDLSFSGEMSSIFTTTLVGYDALLTPGQYALGTDAVGNAIASKTKVNGSTPSGGYVYVSKKGNDYVISGVFPGANGEEEVFYWTGALPFVPDPDPLELTVLQQAQKNQGLVTLQLATAEFTSEFDMTTYQNVLKGDGKYLALDLYSEDGYLHDGEYKACAVGGVVNAGEFGIGYDTIIDYVGWDGQPAQYEAKDWGTCLWTVTPEGNNTAEKITDGLVTVSSEEVGDETIWTIYWGKEYPKELLFKGAIKALTKPKPVAKDPDYLFEDKVTPGEACDTHAITITDKEGGELAYVELLTEPGATDLSGSYPATSYAGSPGQMRDGYYVEWGGTIYSGGSYYVDNGEKKYISAGSATLVVAKIAEGAYQFTCEFFDYAAAGPDYVPVGGFDGVVLTKFANKTDYTGWGMKMIALEFCTDDLTPTSGFFGATYAGSGNYLKLEIYAESGDGPAPGTYGPNTVGTDDVAEGQFKAGYDPEGGKDYGTNWFTVTDGVGVSTHITDGTITVSKDGDNYTIIVESTAIKCKYVGPLQ